jgi:hypothetical protein
MSEKPKKQVKLHRDTIKALTVSDLEGVAGGNNCCTWTNTPNCTWTGTDNCATNVNCCEAEQ